MIQGFWMIKTWWQDTKGTFLDRSKIFTEIEKAWSRKKLTLRSPTSFPVDVFATSLASIPSTCEGVCLWLAWWKNYHFIKQNWPSVIISLNYYHCGHQRQRQQNKNKQVRLHQIKKLLHSQRKTSTKWKDNLTNGRKYLQIMYLIRGLYPQHIKNSYNSTEKKSDYKMGRGTKR